MTRTQRQLRDCKPPPELVQARLQVTEMADTMSANAVTKGAKEKKEEAK